jgi:anti-sigma-K factor RskA
MTPPPPPSIERLYDLLAQQATEPLTPAEHEELRELQVKWPHVDPDELEQAAALVHLASLSDPLPDLSPDLMRRLEADAAAHFDPKATPRERTGRPERGWLAASGWLVAACLLLATGALTWDRWGRRPAAARTLIEQRDDLLARGAKRFQSKADQFRGGNVVWDGTTQQGYLTLTGLPPNDPARTQYQLWIVDAGRTHKEPVDGGVFDVAADGTAVVPVKPALAVRSPTLFAVTEEPPGGVVVSEKGKRGEFVVVMAE